MSKNSKSVPAVQQADEKFKRAPERQGTPQIDHLVARAATIECCRPRTATD